jgi:amino acid adenylation domain-containing protein
VAARLNELLSASAARFGDRVAVEDPAREKRVTYDEFRGLVRHVAEELARHGVQPGDRVGISGKSIPTLAAAFGAMEAGAAYVPVDVTAPPQRNATIFGDCSVRAMIVPRDIADGLIAELHGEDGATVTELEFLTPHGPEMVLIPGPTADAPATKGADSSEDIAYILYTSGSTGKPKGVIHSHASALSFVDWCSDTFEPSEQDRFSSHAPFHFDLSILDIYVSLKHGAALVLIADELSKHPGGIAKVIADRRITVWYSTPSILRLLVEFGKLDQFEWPALRLVLFAGEVFPIKYLNRLMEAWPDPRYFNLYGPTETNVCTYYEVPGAIPEGRVEPFPIGPVCENDRALVLDGEREVARGEQGELCITGGTVMRGYWNLPERSAEAFHVDANGERWYRTGDIVREVDGDFVFLGRRDRMTKRRGYRIELGEIEAVLHTHPDVREAAVIATTGDDGDVRIVAFLGCEGGTLSMLKLKGWCAKNLARYMMPDQFSVHETLPKTSTDKTDYQALSQL